MEIKPAFDSFTRDPIRESVASILTRLADALAREAIDVRDFAGLITSFAEVIMSKRDLVHASLLEILFANVRDILENRGAPIEDFDKLDRIEERILLRFTLSRFKLRAKIPPSYYWYLAYKMLETLLDEAEMEELRRKMEEERRRFLSSVTSIDEELRRDLEAILFKGLSDEEEVVDESDLLKVIQEKEPEENP